MSIDHIKNKIISGVLCPLISVTLNFSLSKETTKCNKVKNPNISTNVHEKVLLFIIPIPVRTNKSMMGIRIKASVELKFRNSGIVQITPQQQYVSPIMY